MLQTVVMVTTSYPRFAGDSVGTFMEPIARGVAARGHRVHLVAPWHPRINRPREDSGVTFHFFRYAPLERLNVFGYAGALRADTHLRLSAYAMAPVAVAAGWHLARTVARREQATVLHGHWVVPGGAIAAAAAGERPVVISLHGSDVYVAEKNPIVRRAAAAALRRAQWVTACSADLARRAVALGADPERMSIAPYGVDADRFRPDANARVTRRAELVLDRDALIVFAAGRLVRKKGFEYLLEAMAAGGEAVRSATLVIAGSGDLMSELTARASTLGIAGRVRFIGDVPQPQISSWLAAADIAVVPSIRDDAGNVDGLPNVVMEALASGTPLVATAAGGIGAVVRDGETALLVPERDAGALAAAISRLVASADERQRIGTAARGMVITEHGWGRLAQQFEAIYQHVTT